MYTEKKTIFIDGSSGTAGLRIYDRLAQRTDITLLTLPPELRHDIEAQRGMLNRADIAFLCLPDAAAITAADLVENPDTVVLDTSTAHRTAPDWTYGFPELSPERETAIRTAKRIAVPGCHASGFVVLTYPLVEAGILPPDALLTCYSLTGYMTGSVSSLSSDQFMQTNPLSLEQALKGKISGVQVMNNDGAPGGGITIKIRGASSITAGSSPLYVIDGFPLPISDDPLESPLATISPDAIESISILKDVSSTPLAPCAP